VSTSAPAGHRTQASAPAVDVLVESDAWHAEPEAEAIVRAAIAETTALIGGAGGEVAVMLTSDEAIRELNRRWRGIDAPTNVLSFSGAQTSGESGAPAAMPFLGDIAIAYETTAREAAAEGKPLPDHLAHLAVHGFLHLIGYDHDSDAAAHDMERLEARILAGRGVPDPYAMRDGT
jgi:probable rRNA maturation factor